MAKIRKRHVLSLVRAVSWEYRKQSVALSSSSARTNLKSADMGLCFSLAQAHLWCQCGYYTLIYPGSMTLGWNSKPHLFSVLSLAVIVCVWGWRTTPPLTGRARVWHLSGLKCHMMGSVDPPGPGWGFSLMCRLTPKPYVLAFGGWGGTTAICESRFSGAPFHTSLPLLSAQ